MYIVWKHVITVKFVTELYLGNHVTASDKTYSQILGQTFVISWSSNTSTVIFRKVEEKKSIFLSYPLTLNIICCMKKKYF